MSPASALQACLLASLACPASATAQTRAAEPDRLFRDDRVLEIELRGPIETLMDERSDEEQLGATIRWTEADGRAVEVAVQIRARGNYRRQARVCSLPPIRLNFKTADVENTLFDSQDKLKVVTHCDYRSGRHDRYVLREYVAYRLLNLLTDISYRVRLLRMTYVETDDDNDTRTAFAFVIEDKDRFAARTGLPVVEIPGTRVEHLEPAYTNLVSVFEYMIGNTDFSPIAGPPDDDCCHNMHLFGSLEEALFPVPYDFDITGIVDAPYATPNPEFRLRNIRDRLYRGRCVNNEHLASTIRHFTEAKPALYALIADEPNLDRSSRRALTGYLDSFYKTIGNPRAVERRIIRRCLGPS